MQLEWIQGLVAKLTTTKYIIGFIILVVSAGTLIVAGSIVKHQSADNKSVLNSVEDISQSIIELPSVDDQQVQNQTTDDGKQKKKKENKKTESSDNSSNTASTEPASSSSSDTPSSTASSDHSSPSSSTSTPSSSSSSPSASSEPSHSTPSSDSSNSSPSDSSTTDTCGNDVGNGNDIVGGPSGPASNGSDNDRPFRSLTVHPTNSDSLVIGTERNGPLKSTDGGSTWTRLRKGIRHLDVGYPEFWDIAMAPSNTSVIYGATLDSPGPVTGSYPSSMGGIYKTTDSGGSWARKNCGISSSRITSIAVSSTDANIAIAGIEGGSPSFTGAPLSYYNGGIYYTTDGGSNWTAGEVPGDETVNGFWHMKRRGSTFFTFAMDYDDLTKNLGFLKSTDNGKNWSALGSTVKSLRIAEFDVSNNGQTIYAVPRDSGQVKKSTDSGSNWTTISSNANGPIAVSPTDENLVILASCCSVYRSIDGLQTETKIFDLNKVHDIVFAPSDSTVVWLVAEGYKVYKSTDSGANFTLIKNLRTDVLNQ